MQTNADRSKEYVAVEKEIEKKYVIAGERSGVQRSAKSALVVKRRWLDKILAGRKTWEIRGGPTTKRGWIHFAQSGSTGKLMGRARLVVCHRGSRSSFEQDYCHHCVDSWDVVAVYAQGRRGDAIQPHDAPGPVPCAPAPAIQPHDAPCHYQAQTLLCSQCFKRHGFLEWCG